MNVVKSLRSGNDPTYQFEHLYSFCFLFGKSDGAKVIGLGRLSLQVDIPRTRCCNYAMESNIWNTFSTFIYLVQFPAGSSIIEFAHV